MVYTVCDVLAPCFGTVVYSSDPVVDIVTLQAGRIYAGINFQNHQWHSFIPVSGAEIELDYATAGMSAPVFPLVFI